MCIAVIKPKGIDFPSRQTFLNCFNSNPNGAGFMYSDGQHLIIKKGFMTFPDFYDAFQNEKIDKSCAVFFHFRIATHGLVDEGNTHPFPIVDNVDLLRETNLKFKGYGLIHNGVFSFSQDLYNKLDDQGICSDTMIFSMCLSKYFDVTEKKITNLGSAIAYHFNMRLDKLQPIIDRKIGFNKVAIMDSTGEYVKYGSWIEDNGMFYSNDDYKYTINSFGYSCGNAFNEYEYYNNYNETEHFLNGLQYVKCSECGIGYDVYFSNGEIVDKFCGSTNIILTTAGYLCKDCAKWMNLTKCSICGIYIIDGYGKTICDACSDQYCHKDENTDTDIYDESNDKSDYFLCCSCCDKPIKHNEEMHGTMCSKCWNEIQNTVSTK